MTKLEYLSPYIRVATDSIIEAPWELVERAIFDYELLYVKEGRVLVTIEGREYGGLPGDIFLLKPGQRHSMLVRGPERFRQPHIHFDLFYHPDSPNVKVSFKPPEKMTEYERTLFREDVTGDQGIMLPNKLSVRNVAYFEDMLFEVINECDKRLPYHEISAKALFLKLWTYLLRENDFNRHPEAYSNLEELNRVKEYLNCHSCREISLDELSAHFSISKYHLSRLFKKAFGITPIRYSHLVRIGRAREMVQYSGRSLAEISSLLGFSSINAFSRAFRNMEGVPPSFYRL